MFVSRTVSNEHLRDGPLSTLLYPIRLTVFSEVVSVFRGRTESLDVSPSFIVVPLSLINLSSPDPYHNPVTSTDRQLY